MVMRVAFVRFSFVRALDGRRNRAPNDGCQWVVKGIVGPAKTAEAPVKNLE